MALNDAVRAAAANEDGAPCVPSSPGVSVRRLEGKERRGAKESSEKKGGYSDNSILNIACLPIRYLFRIKGRREKKSRGLRYADAQPAEAIHDHRGRAHRPGLPPGALRGHGARALELLRAQGAA